MNRPSEPNGGQGRGRTPDWRPEPQGTWLVIRYDEGDVGARAVPTGEVFWESPDIHVIGGDAWGNPVAGTPVTLEARVSNFGSVDAVPVRVDFSYIAPALGIMPDAPQPIGHAWAGVLAGQSTLVTCPERWDPPAFPTDLHACLIVTCSAPAQRDTPTAPAQAALDRHVAQRNLTIVEASAGQTFAVQLGVANVFARAGDVAIVGAATWHGGERRPKAPLLVASLGVLGAARAAAAATSPQEARLWMQRGAVAEVAARAAPAPRTAEVAAITRVRSLEAHDPAKASTTFAQRAVLAPHPEFTPVGKDVGLEPGQTATVELEIGVPDDPARQWLAVHLAQSQNGQITGGYTVLVRIVKEG